MINEGLRGGDKIVYESRNLQTQQSKVSPGGNLDLENLQQIAEIAVEDSNGRCKRLRASDCAAID